MTPASKLHWNVREIGKMEHEALRARSPAERFGDLVAQHAGRFWFIAVHGLWFSVWIVANSRLVGSVQSFDPFPCPLLTLIVSLEAIFLSLFILMSQNRSNRLADRRAHLDLQVNLLSEHETTKTLQLVQALCEHHGLACARDPEIRELIAQTQPEEIVRELKRTLPTEDEPESPSVSLS